MKIKSVRIQNLRSFKDESVSIDDYTCLVGANGAGKSNVFCAMNIFFRETQNAATDLTALDVEDFHLKITDEPVVITVTFVDLSEEAQKDFADYYRQGQLVISAVATYDKVTEKAEVKQYGQRLGMAAFKPFFKAVGDNAKVGDLKTLYTGIRKDFPDLPVPGTKDAMIEAFHDFESKHQADCGLILSEDQFYGVSKGANRLAQYIQWVHVPAVKDAATEQMEAKNTALGRLLARTVRAKTNFGDKVKELRNMALTEYLQLLDQNQGVLNDISASLAKRLSDWSHPDTTLKVEWRQDRDKSVQIDEPFAQIMAGEGGFQGELPRFGHGLQRSYLLALLQELAGSDDMTGPRLILGCEEPELYQHPPQARHLSNVLLKLSRANSQVIVCTHSPYFISGEGFESVRLVKKQASKSSVSAVTYKQIEDSIALVTGKQPTKPAGSMAKLHQVLQPDINEMFFTSRLILVEGIEDVAYVTSYLRLLDLWDEYRRLGCHIVPANGKSGIIQPRAIAKALGMPAFTLFDSDRDKPDKNGSKAKHEKDNTAILKLCGIETPDPFPTQTLWEKNVVMWDGEIGSVVEQEIGKNEWEKYRCKADEQYGHAGGLQKNTMHIGSSLALAWDDGKQSKSLKRLCEILIQFGKTT